MFWRLLPEPRSHFWYSVPYLQAKMGYVLANRCLSPLYALLHDVILQFCLLKELLPTAFFSSNGNLDPWSGFGVLQKPSPNVVTVMIDQGAHHLDLRKSNPLDPESVKEARQIEKENIKLWISQNNN